MIDTYNEPAFNRNSPDFEEDFEDDDWYYDYLIDSYYDERHNEE
jgi:hypothetical protein